MQRFACAVGLLALVGVAAIGCGSSGNVGHADAGRDGPMSSGGAGGSAGAAGVVGTGGSGNAVGGAGTGGSGGAAGIGGSAGVAGTGGASGSAGTAGTAGTGGSPGTAGTGGAGGAGPGGSAGNGTAGTGAAGAGGAGTGTAGAGAAGAGGAGMGAAGAGGAPAMWRIEPSGTTKGLVAIWGSSATDIWAVGYGTVVHNDGTGWRSVSIGQATNDDLIDVSGSGPDNIWIVSGSTHHVAWHYDGTSWSTSTINQTCFSVWTSGPNDAWAVGQTAISHYDGVSWTTTTPPDNVEHYAVWGSGPDDVWTVGVASPFNVAHKDVLGWTASTLQFGPRPNIINGIWGVASDKVWIASDDQNWGLVARWDGRTWSDMGVMLPSKLYSVWASGEDDIWAVGYNEIVHYDGNIWSVFEPY